MYDQDKNVYSGFGIHFKPVSVKAPNILTEISVNVALMKKQIKS